MAANSNLEKLSGKNVLLTGGCGFIGSEITKQLSEIGSNVTIIDKSNLNKTLVKVYIIRSLQLIFQSAFEILGIKPMKKM